MTRASEPILDYASPRKCSRIRLPAESRITSTSKGAGHVAILEELKGVTGAFVAIVFACFALVVLTLVGAHEAWRSDVIWFIILVVLPWVGLVWTMILVIVETWRKTLIEIDQGTFRLTFSGLFSRSSHRWPATELRLSVLVTHTPQEGVTLGELQVQPADGPLVRLLTDHAVHEVQQVYDLIQEALDGKEFKPPKPAMLEMPSDNAERLARLRCEVWRKRTW